MGAPQYEQAGADIGGTGTTNTIPRWTGPSTLGDSVITQSGSNIGFGLGANTPISRWHALVPNSGAAPTTSDWTGSFSANGDYRSGFGFQFSAGAAASNRVTCLVSNGTATGQTAVWTADGTGNVGIGTATPNSTAGIGLTIYQAAAGSLYLQNATDIARIFQQPTNLYIDSSVGSASGSIIFRRGSTVTESARIDLSGSVCINTTNARTSRFSVEQTGTGTKLATFSNAVDADFEIKSASAGLLTIGTGTGTLAIQSGGTERMRVSNSGVASASQVAIGTSSFTSGCSLTVAQSIDVSQSAQGLKLPATPGNADAQTLDCYQEGTWAPTLAGFGGTNPTVTATLTRVGRLVTLTVQMQSTGGAQYSGTLGATTLTVPAGMTPNIPACTNLVNGAVQNLGNVAAYNDGLIYLPTFALTTAFTFFVVTYRV